VSRATDSDRLEALARCGGLDQPPDAALQDVAALAAQSLDAPMAMLVLADDLVARTVAAVGASQAEEALPGSFCAALLEGLDLLVVRDAQREPRYAASPLIEAGVRFCAAAPVTTREGHVLGALQVMDTRPRNLDARQGAILQGCARLAAARFAQVRELLEQANALEDHERARETLRDTMMLHRAILDGANYAIFSTALDGTIRSANAAGQKWLGYREGELVGKLTPVVLHDPDELAARARDLSLELNQMVEPGLDTLLARARQGHVDEREWSYVRKDGTRFAVRLSVSPLINTRGRVTGFLFVASDVSARKQAEETAAMAFERLTVTVDELEAQNRQHGALNEMEDLLQTCLTADEAYAVVGQFAPRLFPGSAGLMAFPIGGAQDTLEAVQQWGQPASEPIFGRDDCWALRSGRPHGIVPGGEALLCRHVSRAPACACFCVPMVAQDDPVGLLYVEYLEPSHDGQDCARRMDAQRRWVEAVAKHLALVIANIRLRETLRAQAVMDPLTGLFNRRHLEQAFDRELRRAVRKQRPLGLIMLDVDHFKQVNDSFGHDAGDTVLKSLAALLKKRVRAEDITCRYGGEEFLIIVPEADPALVLARAEQLRADMEALTVVHDNLALGPITMSLGVSAYPANGDTTAELIRAADAALYEAKGAGRNRVAAAFDLGQQGPGARG
jgi:diguanylate cyclase (GGDEF)-like protein/PAS domain S-box-containing protein